MSGWIVLEGGAEFGGGMALPDQRALALAGGLDVPVRIIPTAAAPDNNYRRAGTNGQRWFEGLGATDVAWLPLIDADSAADPAIAQELEQAKLIYLLGGFPHFLAQTLQGSRAWSAVLSAYAQGAVVAGSSAGAMVLCEYYFDPNGGRVVDGLNLVPNACVLPHHNTFGHRWADQLTQLLPNAALLGIDERTGMSNDGQDGAWTVSGDGEVVVYWDRGREGHQSGEEFGL